MATYTDAFTGASAQLTSPWVQGRSDNVNNWLSQNGSGACRSGVATTADCVCAYNNTVGNDQYSQVVVGFSGATNDFVYLFVRATVVASWYEQTSGNLAYWFWSNGTSNTKLQYINTSINTLVSLDTANGTTFTAGDTLKLEVVGTTIKFYKNGAPITWTTSGTTSVTDNHVTTGFPGIGLSVSAAGKTVDNWQGGDVSAAVVDALEWQYPKGDVVPQGYRRGLDSPQRGAGLLTTPYLTTTPTLRQNTGDWITLDTDIIRT
jgi:hypothetical protein